MSEASQFAEGKPIRGGIPIILSLVRCARGPGRAMVLPALKTWELVEVLVAADDTITAHLRLSQDKRSHGLPALHR